MQNIEELLEENEAIQISPQGYSMYPMLLPGRDQVVLCRVDPAGVKRGDVLLYRRPDGRLVLHRLWRVKKDGLYMVGDNQTEVEGPIPREQVRGILVAFIRRGKRISVKNPLYYLAAQGWLILRPFRDPIKRPLEKFKRYILEGRKKK